MFNIKYKYLEHVFYPKDIKKLKISELKVLAQEIRDFMIENVNKTGGHLGSSLGTVEITLALHYVFDMPEDKLIWDIGHQSYTHKIITGRKNNFFTLRQKDGISGFSNPLESEYDEFIGGHSSTSISAAFGLQQGLEIQGKIDQHVIAVIGDASIAAGMSFEAINHMGDKRCSNMIVVLNDNDISISKTQGALSKYLVQIKYSKPFIYLKDFAKQNIFDKLPKALTLAIKHLDKITKDNLQSNIFEDLGFDYIGPIDGHDISSLISIFQMIKDADKNNPVFIHSITKKGFGYLEAKEDNNFSHGINGINNAKTKSMISNTQVFSKKILDLAKKDENIVALSAAMIEGTGLLDFKKQYPNRIFDVGIAEQHAVTFAAGLAKSGLKPFVCIYSTFMQRAYDQVIHDVSIASLPVRFIMDRAGFVGFDGATHAGLFDYNMFLAIPNIIFMAPSSKNDLEQMIDLMANINDKPSFIHFSKSEALELNNLKQKLVIGKGEIIKEGEKLAVLCIGDILHNVLEVASDLAKEGINIAVADAKFAKPLDRELIIKLATNYESLLIIEEGFLGAFSSLVIQVLETEKLFSQIKYHNICMVDKYVAQGTILQQREDSGFDKHSLYKKIKGII